MNSLVSISFLWKDNLYSLNVHENIFSSTATTLITLQLMISINDRLINWVFSSDSKKIY